MRADRRDKAKESLLKVGDYVLVKAQKNKHVKLSKSKGVS